MTDPSKTLAARLARIKPTLLFVSSLTVMAGATVAPSRAKLQAYFEPDIVNHAITDVLSAIGSAGGISEFAVFSLVQSFFESLTNQAKLLELLSGLVVTAPGIMIALMAPFAGWLLDRYGRVKPLVLGLILYAVGGTSGLYLDNLYALLAGRLVLGLAVGLTMTSATTLIGDYLSDSARARFVGLQGGFMAIGGTVYIIAGGALADLDWRGPFGIYLVALILIPFVMAWFVEPVRQSGPRTPTSDGAQEPSRSRAPVWPIGVICTTALITMICFFLIPVEIPLLLPAMGIEASVLIGLAVAVMTLVSGTVAIFYGWLRRRLSFSMIYFLGLALMAVGFVILAVADHYLVTMLGLAIAGLGGGVQMPNSALWILSLAPPHQRGRLTGLLTASLFTGQFLSPFLATPVKAATTIQDQFIVFAAVLLTLGLFHLGRGRYLRKQDKAPSEPVLQPHL